MSDKLRKVDYFHAMVPNKPGQGATTMAALAAAGVNLRAFSAFPNGTKTQIDFFPDDAGKLKRAAKKLGLSLSKKKTGFLYQGDDRVGAMTRVLATLAKARINITAVDAVTSGKGRFGAIFWVKPKVVAKAAKLLKAR